VSGLELSLVTYPGIAAAVALLIQVGKWSHARAKEAIVGWERLIALALVFLVGVPVKIWPVIGTQDAAAFADVPWLLHLVALAAAAVASGEIHDKVINAFRRDS